MAKDLKYYLGLKYPLVISEGVDDGEPYFEAEIPELSGCGSQGGTVEQALARLEEAKELWFRARIKRGLSIPEPIGEEDFSGKFLLRITPALHRKLATEAKNENLSLNQYIRKVLEESISLSTVLDRLNYLEQRMAGIYRPLESVQAGTSYGAYTTLGAASAGTYQVSCDPSGMFGSQMWFRRQGVSNYLILDKEREPHDIAFQD